MNQTWKKMAKKLVFGPHLGPKKFFKEFYLYFVLDIIARYRRIQF